MRRTPEISLTAWKTVENGGVAQLRLPSTRINQKSLKYRLMADWVEEEEQEGGGGGLLHDVGVSLGKKVGRIDPVLSALQSLERVVRCKPLSSLSLFRATCELCRCSEPL